MKKSQIPDDETCKKIIDYYLEPHTLRNTFEHFKICKRLMLEILTTYNIRQWTTEEAHKIGGLQLHRSTENMSAEARKKHAENISKSKKAQRIGKTDEEKQAIIDFYLAPNSLRATSDKFNTCSDIICDILKENNIALWTAEQVNEMKRQHQKQAWANMSEEKKHEHSQKVSTSQKQVWKNKSEEEKQAFAETRRKIEQSRTEEERAAIVEKGRQTQKANWAKKSEEEKQEHARKTSEALLARSDDEKQQTQEKIKQTFLENYGVENPLQCPEIHKKYEQTMIEKYGVANPAQNSEIREKISQTTINLYGGIGFASEELKQKAIDTNINLYGTATPVSFNSEKFKEIMLEKYGVEYASQSAELRNKGIQTKLRNNTLNTSQPEEDFYNYLCDIYQVDDIIRQYSDKRYPFNCDFYIKSIDLFIELNCSWTHGKHKFNPDDKNDQLLVEAWKSKESDYYENAITTWTVRDIKKFKAAEENKLNYRAIYFDEYEKLIKGEIPWEI